MNNSDSYRNERGQEEIAIAIDEVSTLPAVKPPRRSQEEMAQSLREAFEAAIASKHPGASNKDLAKKTKISSATIWQARSGRWKNYRLTSLLELAEYIETSVDRMLGIASGPTYEARIPREQLLEIAEAVATRVKEATPEKMSTVPPSHVKRSNPPKSR